MKVKQSIMPGAYLLVKPHHVEAKNETALNQVFGTSSHITVVHTGDLLHTGLLKTIMADTTTALVGQTFNLDRAIVSSFIRDGRQRHDVLLYVDDHGAKEVEDFRATFVRGRFEKETHEKFNMRQPHVTVFTCWDSAHEADKRCEEINKMLPLQVYATGVSMAL